MATTPNHGHAFRSSLSKTLTSDRNAHLHDPSKSKTSRRLRRLANDKFDPEDANKEATANLKLTGEEAKEYQKVMNMIENMDEIRLELRTKVHDTNMKINRFIKKFFTEIEEDLNEEREEDEIPSDDGPRIKPKSRSKREKEKDQNKSKEREKKLLEGLKSLKRDVRNVLLEVESEIGDRFRDVEGSVKDGSIFEKLESKEDGGEDEDEDRDVGDVSADRTLVDPPNLPQRHSSRNATSSRPSSSKLVSRSKPSTSRDQDQLAEQSDESPTKDKGSKGTKRSSDPQGQGKLSFKPNQQLVNPFVTRELEDLKFKLKEEESEKMRWQEEWEKEKSLNQELNSNLESLTNQNEMLHETSKKVEKEKETLEGKLSSLNVENQRLRSLFNPSKHNKFGGNQSLLQPTYQTMAETSYESLKIEILDLKSELVKAEDENAALNRRIEDLLSKNKNPNQNQNLNLSSPIIDEENQELLKRIKNQSETIDDLNEELRKEKRSAEEERSGFELERKEWKEFLDWWVKEKNEKDRIQQEKIKEKEQRREERRKNKSKKDETKHNQDLDEAMQDLPNEQNHDQVRNQEAEVNSSRQHPSPSASRSNLAPVKDVLMDRVKSNAAPTATTSTASPKTSSLLDSPRPSLASATRKRKQGEEPSPRELKTLRRLSRRAGAQRGPSSPPSSSPKAVSTTPKRSPLGERKISPQLVMEGSPSSRSRKRIRRDENDHEGIGVEEMEKDESRIELVRGPRESQKENVIPEEVVEKITEDIEINQGQGPEASPPSSSDTIPCVKDIDMDRLVKKSSLATERSPQPQIVAEKKSVSTRTSNVRSRENPKPKPSKQAVPQKAAISQAQAKRRQDDGWIVPDRVKAQEAKEKKMRERFELEKRNGGAGVGTISAHPNSESRKKVRRDSFGSIEDDEEEEEEVEDQRSRSRLNDKQKEEDEQIDWREQIKEKRAREMKELKENPYKYKGIGRYAEQNKNAPSINQLFETDPAKNMGEKHAFKAVIRDKAKRKEMHGHDCPCCKQWYEDVGPPPPPMGHWLSNPASRGDTSKTKASSSSRRVRKGEEAPEASLLIREDQLMQEEAAIRARKQKISRHREVGPPAQTPPDYWTMDFPTEERVAELKQEAREERQLERDRLAAGLDPRFKRRGT